MTIFRSPQIRNTAGARWFDSRPYANQADKFIGPVRTFLQSLLPDEDPGRDFGARYQNTIAAAGDAPAQEINRSFYNPADYFWPSRIVDLYTIDQLYSDALRVIRDSRRSNVRLGKARPKNDLEAFFWSPEMYARNIAATWERFDSGFISARKSYPSNVPGRPVERTATFVNQSISGLNREQLVRDIF